MQCKSLKASAKCINVNVNNILQQLLVCVSDVPGVEMNKTQTKSVKEGESVTLDPGVMKNPKDFDDVVLQ